MNTLQKIQKAFDVFRIIAKVCFILSIVGAAMCGAGLLTIATVKGGGQIFSLFGEPIKIFDSLEATNEVLAALMMDTVALTINAVLLGFVGQYFKIEQEAGTPFSEEGAVYLRKLGIRFIYLPIISEVVCAVIRECLGATVLPDLGDGASIGTGLVLILASVIFFYGAELESRCNSVPSEEGILEEAAAME